MKAALKISARIHEGYKQICPGCHIRGVGGGIHTHELEQDAGCGRRCLTCTDWLRNSGGGGGDSVGEVAIFRPRSLSIARFPASSTNVFEQLAF